MNSLREAVARSWFPRVSRIGPELGVALGWPEPLSLTQLVRHLDQPEEQRFTQQLDADALHGSFELVIRSDGSYSFTGHMRATGAPSFLYKWRAFVRSVSGVVIAVETVGRVFGSDTPGDAERRWDRSGISDDVRRYWWAIRSGTTLEVTFAKELAGVFGAAIDIVTTAAEMFVAAHAAGPIGAFIVLLANATQGTGEVLSDPNALAGVTMMGGVLLVFGPGAIVPAVIAGGVTAAVSNINHRALNAAEISLAESVFGQSLPIAKIILTDLSHAPNENGVAREFCIPTVGGPILMGMGRNYDNTLGLDEQRFQRGNYPQAGQVFIHELVHAWQIHHTDFLPEVACKVITNTNYKLTEAVMNKIRARQHWSAFGNEEHATIVDSWYGDFAGDLNQSRAIDDPRFFYVSELRARAA
jgi:hypothetical protein